MGSQASGNFGHAGRPGERGGSAPSSADFQQRSFTYYSHERRDILKTKYMGSGPHSSEELKQGVPFNKHISVYDEKLGKPEPFTKGMVKNTVRGRFAILDLASGKGRKFVENAGGDLSRLNGSIKRAGWSGYRNSESGGMDHVVRLLHDVPTGNGEVVSPNAHASEVHAQVGFDIQGERMPNRKLAGSSMGHEKLGAHTEFNEPKKVEVTGRSGYRKRTAEDVVAIDMPKTPGADIMFHRRYPGGRIIKSPYKSENITRIKIRSSHQNPERNYFLS